MGVPGAKKNASPRITYTASSCSPFSQSERPSPATWPVIRTARNTVSTSPGGNTRSTWRRNQRAVGRRQEESDRGQGQHGRLRAGSRWIEALLRVAQAAGEHGGAQYEQDIADDGAGDRGLHHIVQSRAQSGERDDQFGRVAEGRVQQAAHAFAGTLRELLGRAS